MSWVEVRGRQLPGLALWGQDFDPGAMRYDLGTANYLHQLAPTALLPDAWPETHNGITCAVGGAWVPGGLARLDNRRRRTNA